MKFWLMVVILGAGLFLAARFAYHHLRPPDPDYQRREESAVEALASLPQSCRPAKPPPATSKQGEAAQGFDLSGIKLYIPARNAIAQVAKLPQFKGTPEVSMRSCVADELAYNDRVRTAEKPGQMTMAYNCVGQVSYHAPKEDLTLDFVEHLPDQPGCMVVKQVSDDKLADLVDDKTEARLVGELEKKYGLLDNQATLWGENTGAHIILTRGRADILLELTDAVFAEQMDAARAKILHDARIEAEAKAKHKRTH